ncbi:hypothetical protein GF318_03370 [Candidatus Micrarchaeota archaeon]|nr:hypothetical protein [Candidatus Micrarchaeota archaeon]
MKRKKQTARDTDAQRTTLPAILRKHGVLPPEKFVPLWQPEKQPEKDEEIKVRVVKLHFQDKR